MIYQNKRMCISFQIVFKCILISSCCYNKVNFLSFVNNISGIGLLCFVHSVNCDKHVVFRRKHPQQDQIPILEYSSDGHLFNKIRRLVNLFFHRFICNLQFSLNRMIFLPKKRRDLIENSTGNSHIKIFGLLTKFCEFHSGE